MPDEPRTLVELYRHGIDRYSRPDRFLQKAQGAYRPLSTADFDQKVRACAGALAALGVVRSDRVAILSYNRVEWAIADWACQMLGVADVPIYSTLPADQCAFILRDSGAKVAFVENALQLAKVQGHVAEAISFEPAPGARVFQTFVTHGTPAAPAEVHPDDLATLVYTSGTTGVPKGVMLTHRNIVSNVLASGTLLKVTPADTALSFLPLSHSFERLLDYAVFYRGASISYAERVDTLPENLREVRPTLLGAVPRVYEKLYAGFLNAVDQMEVPRRAVFVWARRVGARMAALRRHSEQAPLGLWLQHQVARTLVFRRLAAQVGGRIRFFISGGGPLSPDIVEFFDSLDLPILEGYGLTEASPVLTLNLPGRAKLGTVGRPIPGVEIRVAPDGEILARGPNIMRGYHNRPEDTAECLRDGWLATGDIGTLDDEGYLRITDRKKDLLKTSGGKYVAPQPIETALKLSPHVQTAVVIGNGRKFPAALIVPSPGAGPAEVQAAIDAVNRTLAPHEQLKKFLLLDRDFSLEEGEVTPTLKVRRRVVEQRHEAAIQALYGE